MILKTSCKDCIFSGVDKIECKLDKPLIVEETMQRTPGLCGHKKKTNWLQNLMSDKSFIPSEENRFRYSDGEYKTISAIIHIPKTSCIDCKIKQLKKTIDKFGDNPLIKKLIVSTYQEDKNHFVKIAEFLKENYKKPWVLDSYLEKQDPLNQIEKSTKFVETYWFMTIFNNSAISNDALQKLDILLSDKTLNPLSFYFRDNDIFNLVIPIYAFKTMDGHNEMNWIEKVKTFDNWEAVSIKIQ